MRVEHDLAAVDLEAAGQRGPTSARSGRSGWSPCRRRRCRGRCPSFAITHLEVRRHDRPRRAVVLQLEGAARRASPIRTVVTKRRGPLGPSRVNFGKLWRPSLKVSTVMYQSSISTDSTTSSRPKIVHHGTWTRDPLRGEERPVAVASGRRCARSLTTKRPRQQPGREAADRELALQVVGAAALGQAAQRRTQVDAEERDEDRPR